MQYLPFFSSLKTFGHAIPKGTGHDFWGDAHTVEPGWASTLPRGLGREQRGSCPAARRRLAGCGCRLRGGESSHHAGSRQRVQGVTLFCSPPSPHQRGLLAVQWEGQEENHHRPRSYPRAGKGGWGTQQRCGPKAFGEPWACPESQLGHLAFTCMLHSPHQSLGSPPQPFPEEISQAHEVHLGLFSFIASILLGFAGFRPKTNIPPAASWPDPAAQAGSMLAGPPPPAPETSQAHASPCRASGREEDPEGNNKIASYKYY